MNSKTLLLRIVITALGIYLLVLGILTALTSIYTGYSPSTTFLCICIALLGLYIIVLSVTQFPEE